MQQPENLMNALFGQAARPPEPTPEAAAQAPAENPQPDPAPKRAARKRPAAEPTLELKVVLPRRVVAALKGTAGQRLTTCSALILQALKTTIPAIRELDRKAA